MTARVLVDASNLMTGGGVQVAVSFLDELSALRRHDAQARADHAWLSELDVLVSPAVHRGLAEETRQDLEPSARQSRPWHLSRWIPRRPRHAVSFSVFGPEYAARRADRRIVGYADVRSVSGVPSGEPSGAAARAKWTVRGVVSRLVARRADVLVVETTALREAMRKVGFREHDIRVVPNTVSGVFGGTVTPRRDGREGELVLVYVARPYPHKNFPFLAALAQEAEARHGLDITFLLTATEEELRSVAPALVDRSECVGVLTPDQLPALYARSDAVVFPSLLEAFSAAPLEGMACGRAVFASDRDFVRSMCGEVPFYFDPLDAVSAASVVAAAWADPEGMSRRVAAGQDLVRRAPTARDRALSYCSIISEQVALHGA